MSSASHIRHPSPSTTPITRTTRSTSSAPPAVMQTSWSPHRCPNSWTKQPTAAISRQIGKWSNWKAPAKTAPRKRATTPKASRRSQVRLLGTSNDNGHRKQPRAGRLTAQAARRNITKRKRSRAALSSPQGDRAKLCWPDTHPTRLLGDQQHVSSDLIVSGS